MTAIGRVFLVSLTASLLGACGLITGSAYERRDWSYERPRPAASGVTVEDAALGSTLGSRLTGSMEREMAQAMGLALTSPELRPTATWVLDSTRRGSVRAGPAFLTGVETAVGGRLEAPLGIVTDYVLEPLDQSKVTTVNANVRLGPSTDFGKSEVVAKGTAVSLLGKVRGEDWVLIAMKNRVLGYMFRPLLTEPARPQTELQDEPRVIGGQGISLDDDFGLAGGVARRPVLCREFEQSVDTGAGRPERWTGIACEQEPRRWRVVPDLVDVTS